MRPITVQVSVSDEELAQGWGGSRYEFEASLVARLDEVYGDDGGAYVPIVIMLQ
jgi:hypothetical protein